MGSNPTPGTNVPRRLLMSSRSPIIPGQQPILTIPYAPIYSEDTGNDDKEFTEWTR